MEEELEVKVGKIVEDPKISLKQFSSYSSATANAKNAILVKSKYPGNYIPRFYEIARKIVLIPSVQISKIQTFILRNLLDNRKG